MHTLLTSFPALIPAHSTVILGLSGGPDSVFLLHQLVQLHDTSAHPFKLIAAHLDHQWYATSDQARDFCAQLCTSLKVTLVTETISNLNFKPRQTGSLEDLGRQFRRYWFQQLVTQSAPAKIWLAHHLDDQIETFLLRLIRGTSLTGLTGIKLQSGDYIRPLLQVTKSEILDYLQAHKINYFTDPTNSDLTYLRNKIRQTVLPALKQADPRFTQNFQRSLSQLQASAQFIEQQIIQLSPQVITNTGALKLAEFKQLTPYLQNQVLLLWLYQAGVNLTITEKLLAEILRWLHHPNPTSTHQLNNWKISKRAGQCTINQNLPA